MNKSAWKDSGGKLRIDKILILILQDFGEKIRFSKICLPELLSASNKYYSSAGHHEQKNKKTTGQIKFLAVTIKQ